MATPAENLDTAINAILAEIAANPLAVSYSIHGQSVSRGDLEKRLKELQAMRGAVQGPIIRESYGVP
jgi:hypothetical protein